MKIDRDAKIELAASGDETREHLCHPYLDVENKCLVATNGHLLVKHIVEIDDGDMTGSITASALRAARKLTKKVEKLTILAGEVLTLSDGSTLPRPDDAALSFPPYEKVIPDYSNRETVTIGLNAKYLLDICKALGGGAGNVTVSLTFPPAAEGQDMLDPIKVELVVASKPDGVAVLMPARAGK